MYDNEIWSGATLSIHLGYYLLLSPLNIHHEPNQISLDNYVYLSGHIPKIITGSCSSSVNIIRPVFEDPIHLQ